jgi:hypothetical protein
LIEISVGEVATWALIAAADHDIFQVAGGDVRVECLDRAIELRRCFSRLAQGLWRRQRALMGTTPPHPRLLLAIVLRVFLHHIVPLLPFYTSSKN